jgi:hypothetical protein
MMTPQEAKLEWYRLRPWNQTDLHSDDEELRALAKANLFGFLAGLKFCGKIEVLR